MCDKITTLIERRNDPMKKLLIASASTILILAGCQNSIDVALTPEVETQAEEEEVVYEPRKLDVVHTDYFFGTTAPAGLDARPIQEELSNTAKAESKRIVQERIEKERIEEEQRLAEEQRIKEEEERQAAEAAERERQAAIAEAAAIEEQQIAQQQAAEQQVASTTSGESTANSTEQSAPAVAPVQNRTDGFNFRGHHFPLSTFSGSGAVPLETPYVYQWTDYPKHYLVERVSPPGRVIQQLQVGDTVTINGSVYTVHHIARGVDPDVDAHGAIFNSTSAISIQTCELGKGINGKSLLTLFFAS